jgi:hypothetical protein
MKTYQAFAQTTEKGEFINTEIKAENIKDARQWFKLYTFKHEKVYLKK